MKIYCEECKYRHEDAPQWHSHGEIVKSNKCTPPKDKCMGWLNDESYLTQRCAELNKKNKCKFYVNGRKE